MPRGRPRTLGEALPERVTYGAVGGFRGAKPSAAPDCWAPASYTVADRGPKGHSSCVMRRQARSDEHSEQIIGCAPVVHLRVGNTGLGLFDASTGPRPGVPRHTFSLEGPDATETVIKELEAAGTSLEPVGVHGDSGGTRSTCSALEATASRPYMTSSVGEHERDPFLACKLVLRQVRLIGLHMEPEPRTNGDMTVRTKEPGPRLG